MQWRVADLRFQSKIAKFPTPVYLTPPLNGFPLELSTGAWGYRSRKKFSDIFIRLDTIHERDGRGRNSITIWHPRDVTR